MNRSNTFMQILLGLAEEAKIEPHRCICGGDMWVGDADELAHTQPTCADYDNVETIDDGIAYIQKIRKHYYPGG